MQALAWLELAGEGAVKEAAPLADALRAQMTAEDLGRVEKLKPQLQRK